MTIIELLMTYKKYIFINYSYFNHMCFILSILKFYWMLPQALEIIFEMERKRCNQIIIRREINLTTYKKKKIFFFSLDPSYFQTS
jgi:hypothetical protein